MPTGLAVFTPFIGLPSETFVARHLTGLAPGRTLAVSTSLEPPAPPVWSAPPCHMRLRGAAPRPLLQRQAARVGATLRGRPRGRWRWEPARADLADLARAFDHAQIDTVLVEYLDIFLPVVPWLTKRGLRVFAHGHGYDVSARLRSPWWREQYRRYEAADGVIVVSEHARQRLAGLGLDPARIHVIPCGVDVPAAVDRPVRDTVHLLAVGRMVPKKDPLATVEAFRLARAEVDGLRLTMVGDGPLLPDVEAAVAAAGLDDDVRLLGARPHADVVTLMAEADLFVQHSVVSPRNGDEEGLPVGILEAMAASLPVVSTRHAGIPEAVEEGVTGLLVQEGDVYGMAAAFVELAHDPARRRAFGLAGHAVAAERFSWGRERRDKRALLGLDRVAT